MFEHLINKLRDKECITLEITPPKSADLNSLIQRIENLKLQDFVDGFSVTDSPLAKMKYNPIIAAYKIQTNFNKPVIATMSMRDRNVIALQSDLLAGNDLNVRCILALTGDPVSISDQPNPKAVLEGNSNMLLEIINNLNSNLDLSQKPIVPELKPFYSFAVTNATSKNKKSFIKKLAKKLSHNPAGIISQPVFSIDEAKELLEMFNEAKSNVAGCSSELIIGYFPIFSLKTAKFLNEKVPHINVPNFWIESLDKEDELQFDIGMKLSKKLWLEIKNFHPKIHVMSVNKFEIVKDIISQ